MKKAPAKTKRSRKTNVAAKAMGAAILADLAELAEALQSGAPLDAKYTIRRVNFPDAPKAQLRACAVGRTTGCD